MSQVPHEPKRGSMRAAVLEFAARAANAPETDEAQFIATLRQIVAQGRSRADDLWEAYHGTRSDARSRLFARFAE